MKGTTNIWVQLMGILALLVGFYLYDVITGLF